MGLADVVKAVCRQENTPGVLHLAEECYTSSSKSAMNSTIRSSKTIFDMGKRNWTLIYSAWRKKVDKTYAKTRLLKLLLASQPIFHFYITDILEEEIFIFRYDISY